MNTSSVVYPAHRDAPISEDYSLTIEAGKVPVFSSASRYGTDISYCYFDTEGNVDISIETLFGDIASARILPDKYGIQPTVSGRSITFSVQEPETYLTLIINDDFQNRPFHIFVNGPDRWNVQPDDENVRFIPPGYHEMPLGTPIVLESDQTLYVAGGAWINGSVVVKEGSSNVKICGHGVLAPDQHYDTRRFRAVQVNAGCSNVSIEGIICNKRVTGWCGIMIASTDITIENYKVVSGAIWSTDGLNPCNCSRVTYNNCFFRCGDDNIAIKGFKKAGTRNLPEDDPKESLPNEDIQVTGCIFWSDNNNALVLGQETKTAYYRNIHFRDCDILYVYDLSDRQGAIALICLDGTNYSDISFEDFRIYELQRNLINMFFTEDIFDIPGSQKWKGKMDGILFKNFQVSATNNSFIRILGWNETNTIENVTLENIVINGTTLSIDQSDLFRTNDHVHGLTVRSVP